LVAFDQWINWYFKVCNWS